MTDEFENVNSTESQKDDISENNDRKEENENNEDKTEHYTNKSNASTGFHLLMAGLAVFLAYKLHDNQFTEISIIEMLACLCCPLYYIIYYIIKTMGKNK